MERTVTVCSLIALYRAEGIEPVLNLGDVVISGWVRTNRPSGQLAFLELHDGTHFLSLQLVYTKENEGFDMMSRLKTGAAIVAHGTLRASPSDKQPFELAVKSIELVGDVAEDYPLQKKRASFEFLREQAYLRPRANTFQAVYRVRSVLAHAIHSFFQERGFVYVHTPIITGNDAEGAGQLFRVATEGKDPFTDFFGKEAHLTVSGQLHGEAFALAFKDIYTFGPTFRAEHSNTPRHASEFWMIEPEMAFCDLKGDMEIIEASLKHAIRTVLEKCPDEIAFFDKFIAQGLKEKLEHVVGAPFRHMTYTEAIATLEKAVKEGVSFENKDIFWGMDLQSEHERYLCEKIALGPLFLTDYPKEIKAFYMKENPDGKTVAAVDLLVPGEGELVGGSQREDDPEKLKAKMGSLKDMDWYWNLRRYGGCPHAGFGIGFDRLLMYVTGMQNIRDVQLFPRTSNALKY